MAHDQPTPEGLKTALTAVRGIGSERAAHLARLKLHTLGDLLLHRPRRYEDRRQFLPIARLTTDQPATAHGRIVAQGVKRFRQGTKSVFEFILDDGSARLHCRWWNLPFMENYFRVGDEVLVYGKLTGLKPRTMDHPETEVIETGEENLIHLNRITPVYPLTEGVSQRWLRSLIWHQLQLWLPHLSEPWPITPPGQPGFAEAVRMIHFPERDPDVEGGRQRLALDEFLTLQLEIQRRRRKLRTSARALPSAGDNRLMKPFLAQLGFELTAAQKKVLRELRGDLGGAPPMRRLLQGDVGAGKTVVAACCAIMAVESGHNVALMAPTELLAEQHFRNFTRWFESLGIPVQLRTGSRKGSATDHASQPDLLAARANSPGLIIGTHALIVSGFQMENLGLVIIDEQHKFGVAQREALVRKGRYPHLLVMTATPIPRTLGLTLYGDLDISTLDALPAGRGRVRTYVRGAENLPKVWAFIREKLSQGRQAYVVYPRVAETDASGLKAVKREYESLAGHLAPYRVGLVHGQLKRDEQERVMDAFRRNEIHVLLATSVIEVGVDVPNATVMLIENAERFGLAQLHQLRGRIGRGAHESHCILVADPKVPEARARLKVLEETSDGFQIADADLELRGPGEFLGSEQSGRPSFRFGDLPRDRELLEQARMLALKILAREDG